MKTAALTISEDFVPAMRPLAGRAVVIKVGGELVEKEDTARSLFQQIIEVKKQGANVILVHGGGRQIDAELKEAGIEPKWFPDGRRDTDGQTLEITHRCLNSITNNLVLAFYEESAKRGSSFAPVGLGGQADIVRAVSYNGSGTRTGKVSFVDGEGLLTRADRYTVPIIHSVCAGEGEGECFNVNADDLAAAIAIAVKADRLILCSNIPGVLDKDKALIPEIRVDQVQALIDNGTITGGMIPKIQSAVMVASNRNVGGVVILNGFDPKAIQDELLSEAGAGTLIRRAEEQLSPKASLQARFG